MAHADQGQSSSSLSRSSMPSWAISTAICKKAREARARAAEAGADLIAFTELFLTGYPIEDLVLKPALQNAAREACEALARDTADGGPAMLMGLPWGDPPFVYNAVALLDRGRIDERALQEQSAELWRVRREAGVRTGPDAGADRLPRHQARRSGLRGHLERGGVRGAEAGGRRAADRAQRLALLDRQAGCALRRRRDARGRDAAAARLCQSGWRTGRARVRRRVLRAQRRCEPCRAAAGLGRGDRHHRVAARERALALSARSDRRGRGGRCRELSRLRHGLARLRGEERLPGRRARALGRHRLGALRGDGRRCAGASPRAWRDAALHLYQQ